MDKAGNEGIDLMKMAVSILLVCLVVSAGVMIFNRAYKWMNDDVSSVKTTMVNATMDKFFDLENKSESAYAGTGNYPLVTMVANTVLESNSPDILFYQIFRPDGTYVAYSSSDLTEVATITGAEVVSNPEDATAAALMQYSGNRCSLTIYGDDDGFEYPSGLYSIIVQVLP